MFGDISRNVWGHSPEYYATFPGMFEDIPRNVWRHSPECLGTFRGILGDIPRNIWGHSPKCLRTFPGMFEDIPRNAWGHSPECWRHSPHSPRSPHSVSRSCIPGFIHSPINVNALYNVWAVAKIYIFLKKSLPSEGHSIILYNSTIKSDWPYP